MRDFLEGLTVNNPISIILVIISMIALFYTIYFFFNKEGRDERGRGIFAAAGMFSLAVMVIMFLLATTVFKEGFLISRLSFLFCMQIMFTVYMVAQVVGILFLKRKR